MAYGTIKTMLGCGVAVLAAMLAGCGNRTMTLIDGLTQEPIGRATAVIEMKASYDMPDPMPYLTAMNQYDRYRQKHHIHGWKDSPPPPLPFGYGCGMEGYMPVFPQNYNLPDRVLIETIQPQWEVVSFQPIVGCGYDDASYQAVMYYFLKPNFLPAMLDAKGLNLLAINNKIRLVLQPARPGTKDSDAQVLHVTGNLLGVIQHPKTPPSGRRMALETLRDLLTPIYNFEAPAPYEGFEKNRAEAKMLIEHIQGLL